MKGTLKRFREQQRLVINLLELFGEPCLLPAQHDRPFKSPRGESDPAATVTTAPIDNELFRAELLEATLQRVFGNCRFPGNPAQAGRLATNPLQAKIQNGLVFGQEN